MKIVFLTMCYIGFLLVGEGCSSHLLEDDTYADYIDSYNEEEPSADYPRILVTLHSKQEENVNTEENQVETEGKRPEPGVETRPNSGEGEKPGSTDFEPFDPEALAHESLIEKVEKLLSDFKNQQDKIAELEESNKRLVLKIDSIEQQVKTNSVILTNVNQEINETFKTTLQKVLHVFNRIMRVRVSASDIAVALRAESNISADNKPIVVRFTNFGTKMRVLSGSQRLSHTNIGISSDYSELVAQRRAALLPYLKQVRAQGVRAYILYDKLVMNGVKMTLEELMAQDESNFMNKDKDQQGEIIDDRY